MNLQGLQKLTLLDYPGRVACTVFTGGCNFRCPFCHNALLVTHTQDNKSISEEEFFSFLKKRQGILDGVCITGGEPLLNRDIADFADKIHSLGFKVKLDTNGSFPERLQQLIDGGYVDYVAMDIKNTPEKYGLTIGCENFDISPILKSVEILKEGKVPYEFRTTVVSEFHIAEDFETIGKWLVGCEKYFLQVFTDSGDLIEDGLHACSKVEMEKMLDIARNFVPSAMLRGV
jgi:pyruvate formate lyase activating enzyme